jgi:putative endonuclease
MGVAAGISGAGMLGIFDFLRRGRPKRTARQVTGREGERAAEKYLKKHGYRVVARNVTYPEGEVDLVALEKKSGAVCFVEVRSRAVAVGRAPRISPEESVTPAKRRRIIYAARKYLAGRRGVGERVIRFDVVAVRFAGDDRRQPDIRHYPNAFDAKGRII